MAKLIYINEDYNQEVSININGDADMSEMIDHGLKPLLLAIGFHPNTVKEVFDGHEDEGFILKDEDMDDTKTSHDFEEEG